MNGLPSAGEDFARGALKSAVLSAIEELGSEASPSSIDAYLAPRLDRPTIIQQVHTALVRMEKQGIVERVAQKASPSRRRPQTIFGLTELGKEKYLR